MNTLRLTLNQSLEEVIQELEQAYKPMSRTEILKMTIAEFYNSRFGKKTASKDDMTADEYLRSNPANKRAVDEGIKQVENGEYVTFKNVEELKKYVGNITD